MDPATVWLGLDCGVRVLRSAGCEANPGTPLGAVYSIIEPPRKAISIRQPKRMKPIMYAYWIFGQIKHPSLGANSSVTPIALTYLIA